jgi:large subunit ribosomal protein L10
MFKTPLALLLSHKKERRGINKLRKDQKREVVENLKKEFSQINSAVLVDYRGLDCEQMSKLRHDLKNVSAEIKVVKNTLLKIASEGTPFEKLNDYYQGPTAVTFIRDNPVEAAKVLVKYAKEIKSLDVKSGLLQDKLLDPAALEALSKLPSKEVLLSMLLSALSGPMRGLATVLSGVPRGFVTALSALKEKKEQELN